MWREAYGLFLSTFSGLDLELDALAAVVTTKDFGVELEFHALLL